MNHFDEELQHKIEGNQIVEDTPDARAYQKVFDALGKEPYYLPANFADRVLKRLEAGSSSLVRDYFWLGLGLISFLIATVITIVITHFKLDFGVLHFLSSYYGLFIFGLAFVLFLQWLDKKVIQKNWQAGQ